MKYEILQHNEFIEVVTYGAGEAAVFQEKMALAGFRSHDGHVIISSCKWLLPVLPLPLFVSHQNISFSFRFYIHKFNKAKRRKHD